MYEAKKQSHPWNTNIYIILDVKRETWYTVSTNFSLGFFCFSCEKNTPSTDCTCHMQHRSIFSSPLFASVFFSIRIHFRLIYVRICQKRIQIALSYKVFASYLFSPFICHGWKTPGSVTMRYYSNYVSSKFDVIFQYYKV